MILNGDQITERIQAGAIVLDPLDWSRIGSNSYDVCLHSKIRVYGDRVGLEYGRNLTYSDYVLDPKEENKTVEIDIPEKGMVIFPGQFLLGATDVVNKNQATDLVPMLEGRSSVARLGLFIHVTAGFGDIGFCGRWTLEIVPSQKIKIYPGMPIGQLYWYTTQSSKRIYKGKYQDVTEVAASRLNREFR